MFSVSFHRPFSYSKKESGSNNISLDFVEFSNVHTAIEALTPIIRTSCMKMYKNIARSRLFGRIAKRSIENCSYVKHVFR